MDVREAARELLRRYSAFVEEATGWGGNLREVVNRILDVTDGMVVVEVLGACADLAAREIMEGFCSGFPAPRTCAYFMALTALVLGLDRALVSSAAHVAEIAGSVPGLTHTLTGASLIISGVMFPQAPSGVRGAVERVVGSVDSRAARVVLYTSYPFILIASFREQRYGALPLTPAEALAIKIAVAGAVAARVPSGPMDGAESRRLILMELRRLLRLRRGALQHT